MRVCIHCQCHPCIHLAGCATRKSKCHRYLHTNVPTPYTVPRSITRRKRSAFNLATPVVAQIVPQPKPPIIIFTAVIVNNKPKKHRAPRKLLNRALMNRNGMSTIAEELDEEADDTVHFDLGVPTLLPPFDRGSRFRSPPTRRLSKIRRLMLAVGDLMRRLVCAKKRTPTTRPPHCV